MSDEQQALVLAQLLSALLPLGMQVYKSIQQEHADKLRPIEDILDDADKNWNDVIAVAKQQLGQ